MEANRQIHQREEDYWRQNHAAQPYARKDYTFDQYAPAYRTGINAYTKYEGRDFEDFVDEVALDYEKENPESPVPWDHARHAVHAAWAKLSNDIGPLDSDRGIRTGF